MPPVRLVCFCVAAACGYGVLHDEITIRVCPEYFTVAHPTYFPTSSLTLLALCWGIAATAPLGFVFGLILARIVYSEGRPPIPFPVLVRSIAGLLVVMSATALVAGWAGFELSRRGVLSLPASFAEVLPPERYDRFMAAWFAHAASYLSGLAGAAFLCVRLWRSRARPAVIGLFPRGRFALVRIALVVIILALLLRFWLH